MPEPCKFPFLDSCYNRFIWTHKGVKSCFAPSHGSCAPRRRSGEVSKSIAKQTVMCFFSKSCHVASMPPENRLTANSDCRQPLPAQGLLRVMRAPHTPWNPRLAAPPQQCQHSHCGCHSQLPGRKSVNLATCRANSPHLVPCDWFLLPFIKQQLRGIQFQSPECGRASFEGVIVIMPRSTCSGVVTGGLRESRVRKRWGRIH